MTTFVVGFICGIFSLAGFQITMRAVNTWQAAIEKELQTRSLALMLQAQAEDTRDD